MLLKDNYTQGQRESYEELILQAIEKLPFTLSFPLAKMQEELASNSLMQAMFHTLDFFEISASYCSFLFLRLLQPLADEKPAVRTALEYFVDRIDHKRPLSFGDWMADLLTPLLAVSEKSIPRHPLTEAFCQYIYVHRKNKLLGGKTEKSVVQVRNEIRGHSTSKSSDFYKEPLTSLEPYLLDLLQALEPLMHCHYDIAPGHYVIDFTSAGADDVIDLFPLVFANEQDYRYVFQTLKDEKACYVSAHENAEKLEDSSMNAVLDQDLQRIVPTFDIAKDLNWGEVRRYMQQQSATYLRRVYAEKKYNQELFVERTQLTEARDAFWQSRATLFPLIGEAGQGKTNQLSYWTETLIATDAPVLIFNSSDFTSQTLDSALKALFGYSDRKDIRRLVDNIHEKAEVADSQVYIFFDALNECLRYADAEAGKEGPLALYQAVCRLFVSKAYPRFKVLFTCRSFTWKNMILPATGDEKALTFESEMEGTRVRGFSQEETRRAYEIYQELYQMQTPFDQIDRRITLRLKDPLTLKFAAGNFLGQELSPRPDSYTSLALYEQMEESIANSYAGRRQHQIVQHLAALLLERYLRGEASDSIAVSELKSALADSESMMHQLAHLIFKKDGITIAYAELLNKAERPILREVSRQGAKGEELHIQFIYERYLEYVMGQAFLLLHGKDGVAGAQAYYDALQQADANVVFVGAMRNALLRESLAKGDFSTLLELEARWGENYRVMSLVNETINTLISENYEKQLFSLIPTMLAGQQGEEEHIGEFNEVVKTIESNKADEKTIARHKELSALLAPTIRLKKLASVSTINGILLTDYFNEGLYGQDALTLLWQIMADPIYDIRNDACMYAYYLSNRTHTLDYSLLRENLTVRIIKEMYHNIKRHSLVYNMALSKPRTQAMLYVETATRLAVLMIIDNTLPDSNRQPADGIVGDMLDEIRGIFRYLTANLKLLRVFMPVLQIAMRRQVTFQANYVNNAMEYQTFWEPGTFSDNAFEGVQWNQQSLPQLMSFCHHHTRFGRGNDSPECRTEEQRWAQMRPAILSAYKTGDSFSCLVLERMQVIMGVSNWENLRPIVERFFTDEFRQTPWFDYCQMSMLYVIYQVAVQTKELNEQLLGYYSREAEDWTLRCRGLFRGRHSDKANATGKYKRNVMSWYAAVCCAYAADGQPLLGDECPVPVFYRLIDKAIAENDKELLYHLVENILELITDMGYIKTALQLVRYILQQFDTQEKIDRIDQVSVDRQGLYQDDLVKLMGNVFSTAKNYFPAEIDSFIQKEVMELEFPGAKTYREDILNYHPSGENLQDVLTHKFGNFLMYTLLNVSQIDDFCQEAIGKSASASNSFAWYEQAVKVVVKHLFEKT